MKGYSGLYVKKTGDTMSGDLNIKSPEEDYYTSLRLKSNNEDNGVTIEWNGNSNRRRVNFYNFPTSDSAYAEAYQFPVNTLDPTTATDHKYYYIVTTKELYKVFPVGSCYTTSTNTNPSSILGGGTWELIDKQFAQLRQSGANVITYNSSNVESYDTAYATRSGHTITIDLGWDFTSTSIDDNSIEVGTLNLSALGVSTITNGSSHVLFSGDAPNGVCLCALSSSGVLTLQDTVMADGADAMTVDGTVGGIFTLSFISSHMLDSACDKFIWKRTA